jgi:hypothetical protein
MTRPPAAPGATEFLVLPSGGHATLLIPRGPRQVAAAAPEDRAVLRAY